MPVKKKSEPKPKAKAKAKPVAAASKSEFAIGDVVLFTVPSGEKRGEFVEEKGDLLVVRVSDAASKNGVKLIHVSKDACKKGK